MKDDHRQAGGRVLLFPQRVARRTPSTSSAADATGTRQDGRSTIAWLPGPGDKRLTSSRQPGALRDYLLPGIDDERRLEVRHKEGITMKTFGRIIHTVGRFAVGFGSGIALMCAYVIVTTDIGLGPSKTATPADAIRLDPVVVTISSDRYDAIRAEAAPLPVLVRTPNGSAEAG
jgi:hypothetical protein